MALEFERPIIELENRIKELEAYAAEKGLDLSDEIALLKEKLERVQREVFEGLSRWQRVQLARAPGRPTTLDVLERVFEGFVELHGDRAFADDPAVVGGLAYLEGRPVVVAGHQKGRNTKENIQRNFGMPHPEGYRKAMRMMDLADRFGRPFIALIDTPGAYPGVSAEERGQAWVIAQSIQRMARLRVPAVAVILGEGGSGGALAIGVGNRVLVMENAWYSVISPESCAAILWRDAKEAPKAAEALKLTAKDLLELGVVDRVIPEPGGGAHRNPEGALANLKAALLEALGELERLGPDELVRDRYERFRRQGVFQEVNVS
ncbi:acetyl-CoA carboxylase carboxyltransferase subunit alpha [Marinithermus hydrothermalis]|uniref:Acetyl-coenzyme A carboxylase carboxyl transferase subunit alpha n=1 Tax=Marinithermus hydrothermalis (strain DSM 14884 / JCM 11576 / T1) TaxID=869210 RepID=F2NQ24_MARHT|nr:acetyl-CoA carboxylase carboxyltransferase subunit alpha [Marinithermus hydrothermalis]AEB11125.1 Acetyl-coenzyme A carboxylase carboxyl transferase subunit alpha [Marinithermus hydrothermalis DSM 14884]